MPDETIGLTVIHLKNGNQGEVFFSQQAPGYEREAYKAYRIAVDEGQLAGLYPTLPGGWPDTDHPICRHPDGVRLAHGS